MKLFALSLEDDATEWYSNLGDDSYKTFNEFLEGFKKKWGQKKEPRHLLAALHNIKQMENETIDEFNTKFRCVVADFPREIKPRDASILIYFFFDRGINSSQLSGPGPGSNPPAATNLHGIN